MRPAPTLAVTSVASMASTPTAIAADAAGNSSGVSNSFYLHRRHRSVVVSRRRHEILDDIAPVTGPLTDGAFTNDRTLTINAAAKTAAPSMISRQWRGNRDGARHRRNRPIRPNCQKPAMRQTSARLDMLETPRRKPSRSPLVRISPPPVSRQRPRRWTTMARAWPDFKELYATVEIHHADGTVGSAAWWYR